MLIQSNGLLLGGWYRGDEQASGINAPLSPASEPSHPTGQ